jgi:hypothetical protein
LEGFRKIDVGKREVVSVETPKKRLSTECRVPNAECCFPQFLPVYQQNSQAGSGAGVGYTLLARQ